MAKTKENKKAVNTDKAAKKPSKLVKPVTAKSEKKVPSKPIKKVTVKVSKPASKVEIKTEDKKVAAKKTEVVKPCTKKADKKVEVKASKPKKNAKCKDEIDVKPELFAAMVLWDFNKWRRGEGKYKWHEDPKKNKEFAYDSKTLGMAIDYAIYVLSRVERVPCEREAK